MRLDMTSTVAVISSTAPIMMTPLTVSPASMCKGGANNALQRDQGDSKLNCLSH
jgi:hypothetical protein